MRTSALTFGLWLLTACGGRFDSGSLSDERCVPGAQVRCTCTDGANGVQACATSGREFLACQCGGSPSSGGSAPGAGGASSGGRPASGGTSAGGSAATSSGLAYQIVDAEYSRALDRVVLLSSEPPELHLFDPHSNVDIAITLPLDGRAVSVAPDGKRAVVGHDRWVTLVDLVELEPIKTVALTCDAGDVVLSDHGYAYAFPTNEQWTEIRSLNLETEEEEEYAGEPITSDTQAKLRPGTRTIYGADNEISPDSLEKYDVSSGAATYLYSTPSSNDYPMCGDLWFREDGETLFTRCGLVFNASDSASDDMIYRGSLNIIFDSSMHERVIHLTHSSAAQRVFAILGYGDARGGARIEVYDDQNLKHERSISLTKLSGRFVPSKCHHVFVDNAGRTMIALCSDGAKTDASYGFFTLSL